MEKMSIELLLDLKSSSKSVISVTSKDTALTAAKVLKKQNVGLLVVIDQNKLVGVVSERDVVQRWVANDKLSNPLVNNARVSSIIPCSTISRERISIRFSKTSLANCGPITLKEAFMGFLCAFFQEEKGRPVSLKTSSARMILWVSLIEMVWAASGSMALSSS